MGNLSKNFSLYEFRCPCCGAVVDPDLIEALQKLRDLIGLPINITSGYRCKKHNREIGGTKGSYHLKGKAADIYVTNLHPTKLYEKAKEIEAFKNGGIGIYLDEGFIHVDVRGYKARWARVNGIYISIDAYKWISKKEKGKSL
ncbi:MAG: DUF882 domain-containing protein [Deltaproteobacteria bacterium]|nr:DUF882 domain-containing protein [Deltaproteobacteria bacterium]